MDLGPLGLLMNRPTLAALVLFLATGVCASAQTLSPDVLPDQYELRFAFNLQEETFTGS